MKKLIKTLSAIMFTIMLTTSVIPNTPIIGVQTVEAATKSKPKINITKKTIYEKQKFSLKVTGTKNKVKWSSNDTDIAIVNSKGTVKGISQGNAVITATVDGKKLKCRVTVKTRRVIIKNITIYNPEIKIKAGEKRKIFYDYSPSNASNKKLTWFTMDTDIVAVNQKGEIKGKKAGVATVSVTSSTGCVADCEVTVYDDGNSVKPSIPSEPSVAPSTSPSITPSIPSSNCSYGDEQEHLKKIKLNHEKLSGKIGDTWYLYAEVENEDENDYSVGYESSNEDIVEVDYNGVVTAKNVGAADIIITYTKYGTEDVHTLKCPVEVTGNYGALKGNVKYHLVYRDSVINLSEYVVDGDSKIFLIPKDKGILKAEEGMFNDKSYIMVRDFDFDELQNLFKTGIYTSKADSHGEFMISNVLEGDYLVYVISGHSKSKDYNNYYNSGLGDATDEYYNKIADKMKDYLDADLSLMLAKTADRNAVLFGSVSIHKNEIITIGCKFPRESD